MKKILFSLPIAGLFGSLLALTAKADFGTSTALTLPSFSDLLGYAWSVVNPLITAFWPIIGLILGLAVFGYIFARITHIF